MCLHPVWTLSKGGGCSEDSQPRFGRRLASMRVSGKVLSRTDTRDHATREYEERGGSLKQVSAVAIVGVPSVEASSASSEISFTTYL